MRLGLWLLAAVTVGMAITASAAAAKVHTWTYPSSSCPRGPAGLQNCADTVAHAGDTIDVKPGVYYENPTVTRRVTIVGSCRYPAVVVLDATSKAGAVGNGVTIGSNGVTLECLQIRHATGMDAVDVNGAHAHVQIHHLQVIDAADGVSAPAGANGLDVDTSSFSTLSDAAVAVASGGTNGDTIKDNTVSGSGNLCLSLNLSRSVVGANRMTSCNAGAVDVSGTGNVITGNSANSSGAPFLVTGPSNKITGNRVVGTPGNAFEMDSADHDIVTGNSTAGIVEGDDFALNGNGATLSNNTARSTVSEAFGLVGNNLKVTKNVIPQYIDGNAIDLTGDDATISQNKVTGGADAAAVFVGGATPVVTSNTASGSFAYSAFDVNCTGSCTNALVTGNVESGADNSGQGTSGGADGFEIYSTGCSAPDCMTIKQNVAFDNLGDGFYLATHYASVSDNVAILNGAGSSGCNHLNSGFEVVSGNTNNVLSDNTARNNACDGFYVDSDGNTLKTNTSSANVVMGFQVEGASNALNGNTASKNDGDGINNDGTLARLTNDHSSGNRQDCTNDSGEGATIAGAVSSDKCADGHDFNWASSLTAW